jgi:hypothetical protein
MPGNRVEEVAVMAMAVAAGSMTVAVVAAGSIRMEGRRATSSS